MSNDIWYTVGPRDIFPEEFGTFLLTDPKVRNAFIAFHADLLHPGSWRSLQRGIVDGAMTEVLSYPPSIRFHPPPAGELAIAPSATAR